MVSISSVSTTSTPPLVNQGHSGETLFVVGAGFTAGSTTTKVNFGTKAVTATVVDSTHLNCTIPSGCSGQSNVSVTAGASTTNSLPFFYIGQPTCSFLSTNTGPASPAALDIFGSGFSTATQVTFGAAAPVSVLTANIASDTHLTNITPPTHAVFTNCVDTVDVVVTNLGGDSTPSGPASQFDYYNVPDVTGVLPTGGTADTTGIIVSGTCFVDVSSVTFTPVGLTTPVLSATITGFASGSVTVDPPVLVPGTTYDVQVTTPGGTSAKSVAPSTADQFTAS